MRNDTEDQAPPANRSDSCASDRAEPAVALAADQESAASSENVEPSGRPDCDAHNSEGGVA